MNLAVKLSTGEGLTVFVPHTVYRNVDLVRQMIADAVAAHHTVGQLAG